MAVKIQIVGLKESLKRLDDAGKSKILKANDAIHQAGFFIESEVKESIAGRRSEIASVDTGRFLGSVRTDNSQMLQSDVGTEVEYSKYLEYGTTKIRPRRHFRNTATRNQAKVKEFVQKAIE